jgi:glycogen synthase
MRTIIAFVVYETPFAPAGGIAAVMKFLPEHVKKAAGIETIVFTPMHRSSSIGQDETLASMGKVVVPVGRERVNVELLRLDKGLPWYFLKPLQGKYFGGAEHPYDMSGEELLRDSLFFGKAVAAAIKARDAFPDGSGGPIEWKLLLQDWEAATTALALEDARAKDRPVMYLTLHNSYDMPLEAKDLRAAGIKGKATARDSVLSRALPIVERTIFTVSGQFAFDLVDDPLQAEVMAPHLSERLATRLLGIDNGPFAEFALHEPIITAAMGGDFGALRNWKVEKKEHALKAFQALESSPEKPAWGDVKKFVASDDPWFVMGGRDDPRQKGYDIAAAAIGEFLAEGGKAQFVLFPIPGAEGVAGLTFLQRLAKAYPGRVVALPHRWSEGFFLVLQAAAFGLMPSLYEPFGMANEFYLNGTPGIGRATGGIIQQIVPLRSGASCSQAVQDRAARWHLFSGRPTGILFRERDGIGSARNDWQAIGECGYETGGAHPDRVEARLRLPLFSAMASELRIAIEDAVRLNTERPDAYCAMLAEGVAYVRRTFSWRRAAGEYVRQIT